MAEIGSTFLTTPSGTTATHPGANVQRVMLASPSSGAEFNAFHADLVPIACWSVGDDRFEFDSSFVRPGLTDELASLAALLAGRHFPMTIFGHADPVGNDDYNKHLSSRRAVAIYALFTRDVGLWESLFMQPSGGDVWATRSIQTMLLTARDPATASDSEPEGAPYYAGPANGVQGPSTTKAVHAFQEKNGLASDGVAGPNTRAKLFRAYMDAICRDAAGVPFQLDPALDFLAGGADAGGKGDYQGCSEYNPILMFSADENIQLSKPGNKALRDAENSPNRRVVAFLFRERTRVAAGSWPCPRAKEGVAACKARFWSDAAQRRTFQEKRRLYKDTEDTFACRFYERIAQRSPCEGASTKRRGPCHVSVLLRSNSGSVALVGRPYRLQLDDGTVEDGTTGDDGLVEAAGVMPGDYLLEVDGIGLYVPALPQEVSRRITRVPGYRLFD